MMKVMVSFEEYRQFALALPGTEEKAHFDNPSFRVKDKIFATYWMKDGLAMLKLSLTDQSTFCAIDKEIFFPVHGAWGKQGATFVKLKSVRKTMFKDALRCAYDELISKSKKKTGKK